MLNFLFDLFKHLITSVHENFSCFNSVFNFSNQLGLENEGSGHRDSFIHPVSNSFQSEFNFGIKNVHIFRIQGDFGFF